MSDLKVYVDALSQPCRALLLFLKVNRIPHEKITISVMRAEHLQPEYMENIHRFGKVPAIDDNGVKLIETIGILRYLARKNDIPDHWYPKDIAKQAKVDEFLEWHHIGLRSPCSMYFLTTGVRPMMSGKPAREEHIKMWITKMDAALDLVEKIWLKQTPYLTGNEISVADLIGICEIEQPRLTGYEPTKGRPKLTAWMQRVQKELEPHYNEVYTEFREIGDFFANKSAKL